MDLMLTTLMAGAAALQAAPADPQIAVVAPAERIICRSIMITGTRFPKRACRTQKQWDALAEKSGDALRELQSRPEFQPETRSGG